ncbi:MAG: hypothetical protein II072_05590 [Clostridia bacterium]|nr:hypothetical protein [Clostridia bacterium]
MKYIFIAGSIGWLLGMSMKNICLGALGIPTLYGLVVGFFFSRWAEQNHAFAYGIAFGLYAAVVLIWLISLIRFLSDKAFERKLEREEELRFVEELKRRQMNTAE